MSRGPMPMGKGGPRGPKPKFNPGTFKRIIKMLFKFYPVMMPVTIVCILFSAVTSAIPAIFQKMVFEDIETFVKGGDWELAKQTILPKIFILIALYVVSIITVNTHKCKYFLHAARFSEYFIA